MDNTFLFTLQSVVLICHLVLLREIVSRFLLRIGRFIGRMLKITGRRIAKTLRKEWRILRQNWTWSLRPKETGGRWLRQRITIEGQEWTAILDEPDTPSTPFWGTLGDVALIAAMIVGLTTTLLS
jgi:hypothetical protein